jgi:acetyl-CoA decarbonylase/synthase complex subunit gamma
MAALTGMQIYKSLPKTNCKQCGFPTCMAFAMQVAAKQKALADCPRVTDEAKSALSDASAPPMKLVTVGTGDKKFIFGQESVMFRHEERFHHPCGVAVRISSSFTDAEISARIESINQSVFERAGVTLKVALAAVEIDGCPNPADRARLVGEKCAVPLVLMGNDSAAMKAAVNVSSSWRPLICKASPSTIDTFAAIAAAAKCPLAIGAGSLEELADCTQKAKAQGVEDLVLAFANKEAGNLGEVVRRLTAARRAAIKKNFRPLGYPSLVEITAESPQVEAAAAAAVAAKYAGIVVINGVEPWELLPIQTTIDSIYTNPQVPNAVEAKLYEIGSVNENSPVFFTTNFSLTYFSLAGEVERSKIPSYICVINTEGLGVLNSYAGDKISPDKVVKTLREQKVAEKVKHRKLIIPGLLPIFKAEIEETSEWKEVIIGPESASKVPAFINAIWK